MTFLDEFHEAINSPTLGTIHRWARRANHPGDFPTLLASIRALVRRYEQDAEESGVLEQYERAYLQRVERVHGLADRLGNVEETSDESAFDYGVVAGSGEHAIAIATGHGDDAGALIVAARAPTDPMAIQLDCSKQCAGCRARTSNRCELS